MIRGCVSFTNVASGKSGANLNYTAHGLTPYKNTIID